jgi:hypothetical protein
MLSYLMISWQHRRSKPDLECICWSFSPCYRLPVCSDERRAVVRIMLTASIAVGQAALIVHSHHTLLAGYTAIRLMCTHQSLERMVLNQLFS